MDVRVGVDKLNSSFYVCFFCGIFHIFLFIFACLYLCRLCLSCVCVCPPPRLRVRVLEIDGGSLYCGVYVICN